MRSKRISVEIVHAKDQLPAQLNKKRIKPYKISTNQLTTIEFAQRGIYRKKPTRVGTTTSDLSKRFMYWFLQNYMRASFYTLALSSKTDSVIWETGKGDLYLKRQKVHKKLDFWNFEDHQLSSKHQKPGETEDESGGTLHNIISLKLQQEAQSHCDSFCQRGT